MYFRAPTRKSFSYFLKVALEHGGCPPKPFQKKQKQKKTKKRKELETVADSCYRELHLICGRASRSDSETHR